MVVVMLKTMMMLSAVDLLPLLLLHHRVQVRKQQQELYQRQVLAAMSTMAPTRPTRLLTASGPATVGCS
jgi:hypothetical protein